MNVSPVDTKLQFRTLCVEIFPMTQDIDTLTDQLADDRNLLFLLDQAV